jgi:glycosyltransferase involved in cell wall biosynthesis
MRRSRLGITAPSAWLLGLAKESGIVGPKSDARVIPNGVDTDVFFTGDTRAARMELGLPLDATIVVFAARALTTNEYKAFPVLEEALERVAGRFSGGRKLLFLGLGESAASRTVGEAELRFVPFMHDPAQMARYYRAADMYVHPARAENLPLTVIEAMACGAPVVATSVGGVPELVVEGETGLLTPLDDATALAEAIRILADDPQRRAAFSAAGAARARERFSLEGQVDATLAWYAECREAWGLPS